VSVNNNNFKFVVTVCTW